MIFGTGVDIIQVARVRDVLARHGDRFVEKILTPAEREMFSKRDRSVHFLATRFAAKEAFVKALGLGFRQGLFFNDLSIIYQPDGRPTFEMSEKLTTILKTQAIQSAHLSLSDEKEYAVAMVILEYNPANFPSDHF